QAALDAHRARLAEGLLAPREAPARAPRTVEQLPTIGRLGPSACVHCHQVYDLRREHLQAQGKWTRDLLWVYPQPENVGLTLEVDRGKRVARVAASSPAERLGLKVGDDLTAVNGVATASIADVQYGLHRGPAEGEVVVAWRRGDQERRGRLPLAAGWRQTDLSW